MPERKYIPALSLCWLTPLYDRLVEGPLSALRVRQEMLAALGDLTGRRVLDVGCGTGTMAIMIREAHPRAEVVGLDGDPQILEIARAKAAARRADVRFEQGMSFALPFPDASFDFVIVSMMLHHLEREDKQRTASELFRVLRPPSRADALAGRTAGGRLMGADFAEARGPVGRALKPFARHFEHVADNLDGLLPSIFAEAGFRNYAEVRRYLLGSLSLFQATKI